MNYGEIKRCDVANGPGVRVTLFVSGCTNHCKGCFQPETWDFSYGRPFGAAAQELIFSELDKNYIRGLTLLGGDPFEPANQRALLPFLRQVRSRYPGKDLWAYTGFTLEDLQRDGSHPRCECTDNILELLDVLVDGPYIDELHSITLRFCGSSNQRLIDLHKTGETGKISLWNGI